MVSTDPKTLHLLIVGLGNTGESIDNIAAEISGVIRCQIPDASSQRIVLEALLTRANQLNGTSVRMMETPKSPVAQADVTLRMRDSVRVDMTFCCPLGPMNEQGKYLRKSLPSSFCGAIVILHDELSHDFGVVKRRFGGTSGGHNGVKSIIEALRRQSFWRLRLGIDHPGEANVRNHVLGKFMLHEIDRLNHEIAHLAWIGLSDICEDMLDKRKSTTSATEVHDRPERLHGAAFQPAAG